MQTRHAETPQLTPDQLRWGKLWLEELWQEAEMRWRFSELGEDPEDEEPERPQSDPWCP